METLFGQSPRSWPCGTTGARGPSRRSGDREPYRGLARWASRSTCSTPTAATTYGSGSWTPAAQDIRPIALCEARRIEAGIFNYNSDMTIENNPFEPMGMERLVELDQEADFIGKDALRRVAEGRAPQAGRRRDAGRRPLLRDRRGLAGPPRRQARWGGSPT